jgi:hypothetical protein
MEKEEFVLKVGRNVRTKRTSLGITVEQLAFDSAIQPKQLIRIELGQINTSIFQVFKITDAMNIPVHEVFMFE